MNTAVLNKIIKAQGEKVPELSRVSGVPVSRLGEIRTGAADPTASEVIGLSRALLMSESEMMLVFFTDETPKRENILKALRQNAGEKEDETAVAVGISLATLRAYERGDRAPRDEVKIRLANHFGISVVLIV